MVSWWILGPAMASGNSTPVITTRNREIPSTPSFQEMPSELIHECSEMNWKPPWSPSKPASRTKLRIATTAADPRAT